VSGNHVFHLVGRDQSGSDNMVMVAVLIVGIIPEN
jgi:hypothetical protein